MSGGTPAPFTRTEVYEPPEWALNPLWQRENDDGSTLYTLGALAVALNRSPISIRKWEEKGLFPKTKLVGARGLRLYRYDIIVALTLLAERAGVIGSFRTSPEKLAWFSRAAHALFKEAGV